MIYWAKALTSKPSTSFGGVQFSTDGALIIAHSKGTPNAFIVVFKVDSGVVLSARGYSTGGDNNYNTLVKSILISSSSSPMAYVLSNYRIGDSCSDQHLFKFNPLTFSINPDWIQKTTGSDDCGHLGLTFDSS